jgi:hypothetical protein
VENLEGRRRGGWGVGVEGGQRILLNYSNFTVKKSLEL